MAQAAELAEEQRQREEEQRQTAIVQAEKERMLREAAHLQPYMQGLRPPRENVLQAMQDLYLGR